MVNIITIKNRVINNCFEKFREKSPRRLGVFLNDLFEKYKSADARQRQEILYNEISKIADESIPELNQLFYDLFGFYMGIPFLPFNLRNLVTNLEIKETKPGNIRKLKFLEKNAAVIYLPNHISNFDSFVIGYFIYKHSMQVPVFIAGKNLFNGVSRKVLRLLNASCLDRERIEERRDIFYWKEYEDLFRQLALNNYPILPFLQPGRAYSGDQRIKIPSHRLIKLAGDIEKSGHPVHIQKVSLSYSRVPEDAGLYEAYETGINVRKSNLVWAWLHNNTSLWKNPICLTLHEPVSIAEYIKETEDFRCISKKIISEVLDCTRVYFPQVFAGAVVDLYNGEEIQKTYLIEKIDEIVNQLEKRGADLEQILQEETAEQIAKRGVKKYKWRRRALTEDFSTVSVIDGKSGIFRYNANLIGHLRN